MVTTPVVLYANHYILNQKDSARKLDQAFDHTERLKMSNLVMSDLWLGWHSIHFEDLFAITLTELEESFTWKYLNNFT